MTDGYLDAPVSAVWVALTTSAGLRFWMAPHADIDLRVGGTMRTNYNATGSLDDPQAIITMVLAFEPERMLATRVAKAPAGFPFPNAIGDMWTVMYFEPADRGRAHVRVVGLGFRSDAESQKMRTFFDGGNAKMLEALQLHFVPGK